MRPRSAGVLVLALVGFAAPAYAQPDIERPRTFLSVGVVETGNDPALFVGGGGERPLRAGPWIGGEAALLFVGGGDRTTLVSLTAGRAFGTRESTFEPAVRGGLALVGASFGWTVGGSGVFWLNRRAGLRVEARIVAPFQGEGRLVLVTAGVAFR